MFFSPLLSGNKGCACIIRESNYSFLVANAVLQKQLCNGKLSRKLMLTVASRRKVNFVITSSHLKDYQQTMRGKKIIPYHIICHINRKLQKKQIPTYYISSDLISYGQE